MVGRFVVAILSLSFMRLTTAQAVFGCGDGERGALGDGAQDIYGVPLPHPPTNPVWTSPSFVASTRAAAGYLYMLALGVDGNVYSWGMNANGQVGNGGTADQVNPVAVTWSPSAPVGGVVNVWAGDKLSVALGADGVAYVWGYLQTSLTGSINSVVPVAITWALAPFPSGGITNASPGTNHLLLAGRTSGISHAYAMGQNAYGQLGDATNTDRDSPVAVVWTTPAEPASGVTQLAAGTSFSVVLGGDFNVYTFGYNGYGQLGDGTFTNRNTPVAVVWGAGSWPPYPGSITQIAAGANHVLVLGGNNKAYTWGSDAFGEQGVGAPLVAYSYVYPQSVIWNTAPEPVGGLVSVQAGDSYSVGLGADGELYAWGDDQYGTLCDGQTDSQSFPIAVSNVGATSLGAVGPTTVNFVGLGPVIVSVSPSISVTPSTSPCAGGLLQNSGFESCLSGWSVVQSDASTAQINCTSGDFYLYQSRNLTCTNPSQFACDFHLYRIFGGVSGGGSGSTGGGTLGGPSGGPSGGPTVQYDVVLAVVNGTVEVDCCSLCRETLYCTHWQVQDVTNNTHYGYSDDQWGTQCTLFGGAASPMIFAENALAGMVDSGSCTMVIDAIVRPDISPSLVQSSAVSSSDDCCTLCATLPSCTHFTVTNTSLCLLYAGDYVTVDKDGIIAEAVGWSFGYGCGINFCGTGNCHKSSATLYGSYGVATGFEGVIENCQQVCQSMFGESHYPPLGWVCSTTPTRVTRTAWVSCTSFDDCLEYEDTYYLYGGDVGSCTAITDPTGKCNNTNYCFGYPQSSTTYTSTETSSTSITPTITVSPSKSGSRSGSMSFVLQPSLTASLSTTNSKSLTGQPSLSGSPSGMSSSTSPTPSQPASATASPSPSYAGPYIVPVINGQTFALLENTDASSTVLYQDFTIPSGYNSVNISLSYFCQSNQYGVGGGMQTMNTSYSPDADVCRIDVLPSGFSDWFNPYSLGPPIATIVSAAPPPPPYPGGGAQFKTASVLLSGAPGTTFRLAIRTMSTLSWLQMGVDAVSVCPTNVYSASPSGSFSASRTVTPTPTRYYSPSSLCPSQGLATLQIFQNGNFESGTLNYWNVTTETDPGAGTFYSTLGSTSPVSQLDIAPPADGNFYAVSDQSYYGSYVMWQSFTIPPGVTKIYISAYYYCLSHWPISVAASMAYVGPQAGPQFCRVDLMNTDSPIDWFGPDADTDVYANIVPPGGTYNLSAIPWQALRVPVTVVPNTTYVLAFRDVNTMYFLNQAVDEVSVCVDPPPGGEYQPSRTPPLLLPTRTPSRSVSPTPSSSSTNTASATINANTATASASFTASNSQTSSQTASPSPSESASFSPSATASSSFTASNTPSTSVSRSLTASASQTASASRSTSVSVSVTPSISPTASPTESVSPTSSSSPSASKSATPTVSVSRSQSASMSSSRTPTRSPSLSRTSTASTTSSKTASETPSISNSASRGSSASLTPTHSPSVTPTRSASATNSPSTTAPVSLTSAPSESSSPSLSSSTSATPSPSSTSSSSSSRTVSASATATISASALVSTTQTISPTISLTISVTRSRASSPSRSKTPGLPPPLSPPPAVSPSAFASRTTSASPSYSASVSMTTSRTNTKSASLTHSKSVSSEPSPSASPTQSSSPSRSASASSTETATESVSPTNTATATRSTTSSASASSSSSSSVSPTVSVTQGLTPTATPTISDSVSLSASRTTTSTETATVTPSTTNTASATATASVTQGLTPTASSSQSPSRTPAASVVVVVASHSATISITASITMSSQPSRSTNVTIGLLAARPGDGSSAVLSPDKMAGVVVGSIAGGCLCCLLLLCCLCRRRKRASKEQEVEEYEIFNHEPEVTSAAPTTRSSRSFALANAGECSAPKSTMSLSSTTTISSTTAKDSKSSAATAQYALMGQAGQRSSAPSVSNETAPSGISVAPSMQRSMSRQSTVFSRPTYSTSSVSQDPVFESRSREMEMTDENGDRITTQVSLVPQLVTKRNAMVVNHQQTEVVATPTTGYEVGPTRTRHVSKPVAGVNQATGEVVAVPDARTEQETILTPVQGTRLDAVTTHAGSSVVPGAAQTGVVMRPMVKTRVHRTGRAGMDEQEETVFTVDTTIRDIPDISDDDAAAATSALSSAGSAGSASSAGSAGSARGSSTRASSHSSSHHTTSTGRSNASIVSSVANASTTAASATAATSVRSGTTSAVTSARSGSGSKSSSHSGASATTAGPTGPTTTAGGSAMSAGVGSAASYEMPLTANNATSLAMSENSLAVDQEGYASFVEAAPNTMTMPASSVVGSDMWSASLTYDSDEYDDDVAGVVSYLPRRGRRPQASLAMDSAPAMDAQSADLDNQTTDVE